MKCRMLLTLGLVVLLAVPCLSRERVLTEIERLDVDEVRIAGFVLDRDGDVSIEAVGFRDRGMWDSFRLNNAWILNAETRNVVWKLKDADSEKLSKNLCGYAADVNLKKGRYEVYYSTHPYLGHHGGDIEVEDLGDFISGVMRGVFGKDFDYDEYRKAVHELHIVVSGDGKPLREREVLDFQENLRRNAVLAFTGLEGDRYETVGMVLEKTMDFQIYAIGEMTKKGNYDYCWIMDVETHEQVWKFDYWNSSHAGGAKKNRVFKDIVSLPAGNYALFCVTDDSHAFDEWNLPPPYDPFFWGVTIQTADPKMARHVKIHDYEHIAERDVRVEILLLGNDEVRSEGFTLKTPMRLRVYAIGEGREPEMYDYSWIVDADTRRTVWEMTYGRTEHAGGGSKNRVVDEIIELEKGNYVVFALTDNSHSYGDWNASPPHDAERWGVTILVTEGNRGDVLGYVEEEDKSVLARIVMVGNNENKSERFELETGGRTRLYAIGEGRNGDMHDYAWIENAGTGRVVWEMTYRMTDHAGGAEKNRVFNDVISLDAGEYIVHYASDGSHSFKRWNASPPTDPMNWGVTVKLVRGK